jgi:hypothetical protein
MADAGVNIEVLYSDHAGQLILVVDDIVRGELVAEAWRGETALGEDVHRARGDEREGEE